MNRPSIIIVMALVMISCLAAQSAADRSSVVESRIDALIKKLTLEEKVSMLGGTGFASKPVKRLGIPSLEMTDGPLGVRWGLATAFPAGVAMAATWDTSLIRRIGEALGEEAIGHGRNTLLGPCVNIQRTPYGGRNFESFGEDPYLASWMAVSYIHGVQNKNVVATVKHFAVNNQETERDHIDIAVSERALREIYLPTFESSVKEASVWAVMDAYNKVNGFFCTENQHLNKEILKNEWGFQGLVMSDWGATHHTRRAFDGGLDLEMPFGEFLKDTIVSLVKNETLTESALDDKIRRILRVLIVSGIMDSPKAPDSVLVDNVGHRNLNREAARASIVLLKNDHSILPLNTATLRSLAVIGPNAAAPRVGGGGSSMVNYTYAVSPLEGLKRAAGANVKINYALGCALESEIVPIDSTILHPSTDRLQEYGLTGEYFANMTLQGSPVLVRRDPSPFFSWNSGSPDPRLSVDRFSARWSGVLTPRKSGNYILQLACDDGGRLYINDSLLINDWSDHAVRTVSAPITLSADRVYRIRIEYYENAGDAVMKLGMTQAGDNDLRIAVAAAAASDAAIVFAGLSYNFESEGFDRTTLALPDEQIALIHAVAKANPNTIVVLNSGAPILMSNWIGDVKGVIEMWYPGQEGGNAIADVLFGVYNPSGKLPCTFPVRWEDCSAYGTFPGTKDNAAYADDIFVGYRHFDAKKIAPQYPFGYGLSYTSFAFSDLRIGKSSGGKVPVQVVVRNTGDRRGAEIVQLYVAKVGTSIVRALKELKGFAKVELAPGEQKTVVIELDRRAFSYYDTAKNDWMVEPGEYHIEIGSSSRDAALSKSITW
jgi:beta-glucosidase